MIYVSFTPALFYCIANDCKHNVCVEAFRQDLAALSCCVMLAMPPSVIADNELEKEYSNLPGNCHRSNVTQRRDRK